MCMCMALFFCFFVYYPVLVTCWLHKQLINICISSGFFYVCFQHFSKLSQPIKAAATPKRQQAFWSMNGGVPTRSLLFCFLLFCFSLWGVSGHYSCACPWKDARCSSGLMSPNTCDFKTLSPCGRSSGKCETAWLGAWHSQMSMTALNLIVNHERRGWWTSLHRYLGLKKDQSPFVSLNSLKAPRTKYTEMQ